jgi:adenosylcobinamide kinase / adenosylcobinamide-phosphate guanylyltransferase
MVHPKRIVFIIGGARSGKSQFALEMARIFPGPKAYLATAQPLDEEMSDRIRRHRESRGKDWETLEEPLNIAGVLDERGSQFDLILLDCLTLWLSNAMMAGWTEEKVLSETDRFLRAARGARSSLLIVSNEVGLGIVPDNPAARTFRDWSGWIHQKVAREADEVYFLLCGIAQRIKGN